MTKKKLGMLVPVVLALGILFASCATSSAHLGRFDTSIAEDQDADLRIGLYQNQLHPTLITAYDGTEVSWQGTLEKTGFFTSDIPSISVPAGTHTISACEIVEVSPGVWERKPGVRDTSGKVTLVAGKTYNIAVVKGVVRTEESPDPVKK
jgi:hypothetical protein